MKKIFTLIAAAAMALGANAQVISFTESDVVAASTSTKPLNGKTFSNGNFSIVITDLEGKFAVDASNAYFGTAEAYTPYAYRLKTNATSKPAGDSKARYITIKAPSAGTVKICARTATSSDPRAITINGTSKTLDDSKAISVDIPEKVSETNPTGTTKIYEIHTFTVNAGDNTLLFPGGAVNFYSFEFIAGEGGDDPVTPVDPSDPTEGKVWDFTNMSESALSALASNSNWAAETLGSDPDTYTRYTYKSDIAKDTYTDLATLGFSDGAGIEVARSGGSLAGYKQKDDGSWSGSIRVDANKRIQLNTSNGVFRIKNLKAGDKVIVNYQSASGTEDRTFSVTNATPATLSAPKSSAEGSNKTETLTVTADGDVSLQQSKAINIFKIALNSELPTGINGIKANTVAAPAVKKYVENGQIVIEKAGKKFNVAGAQLK